MTEFLIHLIVVTIIITYFKFTEQAFVSIGYYPDYEYMDLNLPKCGLRYVPRNIHSFHYNSKCFGNKYKNQTFVDYSEPKRGKTVDSTSNRIYKGTDVAVGESPWTVYLKSNEGVCTGSLLTYEWFITAAHCLEKSFDKKYKKYTAQVWAGSIEPMKGDSIEGNIHKVFVHPNYTDRPKRYDIALLKLNDKFNRHKTIGQNYLINTICLPEPNKSNYNEEDATVFGFGAKSASEEKAKSFPLNNLKKANLQLNPINPIYDTNPDYDWDIVGNVIGDKPSTCAGDSGGPLVQYIDEKNWNRAVLVGITGSNSPFDAPCSHELDSNYFIPVSKNIDWILKAVREN